MSELPTGWTEAEIGGLCDLINGRAFKPTDWTESGLPIVRIQNLNNPKKPFNRFDGEVRERFLIDSGDLLFAWSGTPGTSFGAHVWTGGPAVLNQHIFNVKFDGASLDREFFRHAINQKLNELIDKAHGGVGLRHVTKGKFEETKVSLPPLPEQRRIVRKLDTLNARTTTARTHLSAIAKLVEHYRAAVLLSAFTGKLTADLREDLGETAEVTITDPFTHTQIAPKAWKQHLFSEVCKIVGGSQPPKSNFVYHPQEGYIRLIQIRDYKSDAKATYIPTELARRFCTATDIMIGRYGPPIFQILRGLEGSYNVALMKAEPTKAVDQEFLFWYLHHPVLFKYVEVDSKRTAGQDGVNKKHLERWPIMLPPIEEQREIVHRIETAFSKIDRLTTEAEKALKLTDRLDQRILAKAFAGELVPQDPTDEPATELLARISEARATAPKPKYGRRKKVAT